MPPTMKEIREARLREIEDLQDRTRQLQIQLEIPCERCGITSLSHRDGAKGKQPHLKLCVDCGGPKLLPPHDPSKDQQS